MSQRRRNSMQDARSANVPSSLARSTLITMGVRIAVVIVLTTFFSYLHIFNSFRSEALVQMERNVLERSQREQAIFALAEDNHVILKKALEDRIQALRQEDPGPRFDSLFVQLPDGTIRNRPEGFDAAKTACLYIPKGATTTTEDRRWILASHDVLAQYGPAFHARFTDTYITLSGGALLLYWPERPTYCQEADPDVPILSFPYFTISTPETNAPRKTAWTAIFKDPVAVAWLVSVSTPVDMDGRHAATLSHDILIDQLMARTINDRLPGTYNMLFRDDGELIIHPDLNMEGATESYNILSASQPGAAAAQLRSESQRAHVRRIFDQVKNSSSGESVQNIPEDGEYVATAKLKGPGWNFVTVMPERVVSSAALRVARYVLGFGVLSLVLELAIMYWALRKKISQPLQSFTQATARLTAGDFKVGLDTSRGDELGQLARAFQQMAAELQRREEALRQANEGLEHRVEERTQELKEVHRQLVETARQVGRAEIATNVLHSVGNVLNSVYTSAVVARERLAKLKLENIQKTVALLEEHQADLAAFLTQDERGRNALPFLNRLGKHLQAERQEIQSLLGDVSRHTEHIGAIVKLQQRYARIPQQMLEPIQLEELVEDALRINQAALSRHSVTVERELAEVPLVQTEKHKVLMILVNLISNAKYALGTLPEPDRRLTVRMYSPAAGRARLEVRDNGVGIAPDMLTRIFQYGFTTREDGHGFGLHSSALAAQELGGTLSVHSDGPGKGATFTLELPITPEPRQEQAHG